MKRQCFLIFFFCLFFISRVCCQASANKSNDQKNIQAKIYVAPQDILISDEGLFLADTGYLIPLKNIAIDDFGIYVVLMKEGEEIKPSKKPECLNGHQIYHDCGGCANWWCNFRCKCYSPWSYINLSQAES